MKKIILSLLLLSLVLLSYCKPKKTVLEAFDGIDSTAQPIIIQNNYPVNNIDGHIQGVQYFDFENKGYYFLSGSSDSQSYYAIADADNQKIISLNTFLEGDFRHAGGFQITDDLLAVGIEDNVKVDKSKVQVFKIKDPKKPELQLLKTIDRKGIAKRYTAGCVALTRLDKNILVAVGNWDSKNIDFYSMPAAELYEPNTSFNMTYSFDSKKADRKNWVDTVWYSYQNINFLRDSDQQLYLIGTAQKDTFHNEVIDLFKIDKLEDDSFSFQKVRNKTFANKDTTTTFKWGGGIYVSELKNISVFSSERNITDSLKISRY